ncbi:MAG: ABC transporter permease [Oscillibacter sp.]|jgi:peptide/nickel transport system permease protein|nr:ABC transporter permease [Oscillibacter sp.]
MRYAARKLLTLLFTMVIVSLLTFAAFSLIPGDPATARLGMDAAPEEVAALREAMGLNRPLGVRYLSWLAGFFTGDLGSSYSYSSSVSALVGQKLPATLALSLLSFSLVVLISIPLGVRSVGRAARRRTDAARTAVNQLLMALPPFFTGILLTWLFGTGLRVFGVRLQLFVPGRLPAFSVHPGGFLLYLLFPAVAVAVPRIAMTVRMLHSTLLREMNQDYVRTSISRGSDRAGVLYRHVLKNAMVPVVAFLAQTMAEVVAGSIVVEQVFSVPGLGRLLLGSIGSRDWPVVQAIVVILAFWVVLAGTVGDLIAQRLDPRLRLGGDRR